MSTLSTFLDRRCSLAANAVEPGMSRRRRPGAGRALGAALRGVVVVLACVVASSVHAAKLPRLVLAGPPASVSDALVHMVDSGALADVADEVEFLPWRDPDHLRAIALGKQADVLAMPVNVAANLYNRGVELELVNVSTWGILWVVTRDAGVHTLADLRGKEVAMPFRGDMPDLLFGVIAEREGITPGKDIKLRYVASPIDAMQLLVMRQVDHALLAEPAVSMALRKTGSFPLSVVAPTLFRGVDMQAEWGRAFQRAPRIPQAGIVVMGALRNDPKLVARIAQEYARSLAACRANPAACGEAVAKRMPMISAEAAADAIRASPLEAVPAATARPELEFLFKLLLERSPGLVGGKLPGDAFYWRAPQASR